MALRALARDDLVMTLEAATEAARSLVAHTKRRPSPIFYDLQDLKSANIDIRHCQQLVSYLHLTRAQTLHRDCCPQRKAAIYELRRNLHDLKDSLIDMFTITEVHHSY